MATRIIWGYVNEDGKVQSGSGDFTVTAEKDAGFYDITFDPDSFNVQPAIVGSCFSTSEQAPVFYIYSLNDNNAGFVAETRDGHSGDRDKRAFMFTAIGTTNDSSDDDVALNTNDVNQLIENSGGGY